MTFERWWRNIGSKLTVQWSNEESSIDELQDVCKRAWNGAVRASHACVVIDGNPQVAKDKIAELEAK